jgi:cytochrome c oxidase subunit 4
VYLALIAGLAATVCAAYVHLGPLNVVTALAIAFAKATLVVLYFMHVRDAPELNWIAVGAGLVWLSILFGFVLMDYESRDWLPTRAPAQLSLPLDEKTFQPPRATSDLERVDRRGGRTVQQDQP